MAYVGGGGIESTWGDKNFYRHAEWVETQHLTSEILIHAFELVTAL